MAVYLCAMHQWSRKKASKDLAQHYLTLGNFLNATYDDLCSMQDMGGITAQGLVDFVSNDDAKDTIQKLLDAGVLPQAVQVNGDKFAGMTFVITGTLQNPRKYYQDMIEKMVVKFQEVYPKRLMLFLSERMLVAKKQS